MGVLAVFFHPGDFHSGTHSSPAALDLGLTSGSFSICQAN